MKETAGTTGLIFNEPLLWEKGKAGRTAFSLPRRDVEKHSIDEKLCGDGPDFPDLSEVDIVRHYIRLSQWNFSVDSGMYPLGSCTMKYNPKTNERQASQPGFALAHPLLPESLSQGLLKLMSEMERYLTEITGMDATTLQPAAGAQGLQPVSSVIAAECRAGGTAARRVSLHHRSGDGRAIGGGERDRGGHLVEFCDVFDTVRDLLEEEEIPGARSRLSKYLRCDLLIIDDMGIKQLPALSGEYLFEIIMRRYQLRSTIMTSNRPLEDWGKLIGDVPAATAILDRFLHHAELIAITGKSYRLRKQTGEKKAE